MEKKAFVFDTNFIIQAKDLDKVISELADRFSIYVTQVSIEERIAQQCRELKERFVDIDQFKEKNGDIAEVTIKIPYEELQSKYKRGIQKRYEDTFVERIIPLSKNGAMLTAVLNRAYAKEAPFLSDDRASDKGFKDALMWESMLAFFKSNGEPEIIFITDDNGFRKNQDVLTAEFHEKTGKTISIYPNSYYKDLLTPELIEGTQVQEGIPCIEQLRDRIHSLISDCCYYTVEDDWGNDVIIPYFSVSNIVDSHYVEIIFSSLRDTINQHLFEKSIDATEVFELDGRIFDVESGIPIEVLERTAELNDEIRSKYPNYLDQFYSTVANIINRNYRERSAYLEINEEEDLPF